MRQSIFILGIAGAALSPLSFAQSAQGSDSRPSTTEAGSASPRGTAPASKAHSAMASFDSLLREAALQSQATQRAKATQPTAAPAQPAPDAGDALASTPDPGAVH